MKTFTNIAGLTFIKLPVYIIIVLLMGSNLLHAQHEHPVTMAKAGKNAYIAMMDTMMADMHKVSTGNTPETAFLQQMIPHHQGAVVMAEYEITHGKSAEMVKLAKSILIEQKNEIKQMQLWLKQAKLGSGKLAESFTAAMAETMNTMMSTMPKESELDDTDRAFAAVMKPHHQAAIDMARVLLQYSKNGKISAYAKQLIASQQVEVNQMTTFLKSK